MASCYHKPSSVALHIPFYDNYIINCGVGYFMSPFSNPVHYPSKYCDLKSNMDRNNITDFQFQTIYLHYRAGLYMTINVRISGRTLKAIGYMTTLISYLIQLH